MALERQPAPSPKGSVDEAIRVIYEANVDVWNRLQAALLDVTSDERDWRPVPEANSINVIVRHLRIEAAWHLNSLREGSPMPTIAAPVVQEEIDAIPLDLAANLAALTGSQSEYLRELSASTLAALRERTSAAYGNAVAPKEYFIAYHNAIHLAMHCGQIRTLRNMYRKTRGEPARFVPENPTYPRTD
jgi:hypothetical protein